MIRVKNINLLLFLKYFKLKINVFSQTGIKDLDVKKCSNFYGPWCFFFIKMWNDTTEHNDQPKRPFIILSHQIKNENENEKVLLKVNFTPVGGGRNQLRASYLAVNTPPWFITTIKQAKLVISITNKINV